MGQHLISKVLDGKQKSVCNDQKMQIPQPPIPDWITNKLSDKQYLEMQGNVVWNEAKLVVSGYTRPFVKISKDIADLCFLYYFVDLNSHFTFLNDMLEKVMTRKLVFDDNSNSMKCTETLCQELEIHYPDISKEDECYFERSDGSHKCDNVLLRCTDRDHYYAFYWNEYRDYCIRLDHPKTERRLDSFVISRDYGIIATKHTERELKVLVCLHDTHEWELMGSTHLNDDCIKDGVNEQNRKSCVINSDLLYLHRFSKNKEHNAVIYNMESDEWFQFPWRSTNVDIMTLTGVLYNQSMKSVFVSGQCDNDGKIMVEYHDLMRNEWNPMPENNTAHLGKHKLWFDTKNEQLVNIAYFQNNCVIREYVDLRQNAKKWSKMELTMELDDKWLVLYE